MDAQTAGQARRTRARTAASVVVPGAAASVAGRRTFGWSDPSTHNSGAAGLLNPAEAVR